MARTRKGPIREPVGIGRLLREIRETRGFTQGELASRAGITQSAVSQIESGVRPNPNLMTLRLLEEALGDPPVRLAYELVTPRRSQASLERFLATALGQSLDIGEEEIDDLKQCVWFGEREDPSDAAWHDFVVLRRRVRAGDD